MEENNNDLHEYQWACLCLGFVLHAPVRAPRPYERPKLFGRSSLQNERQSQAPPVQAREDESHFILGIKNGNLEKEAEGIQVTSPFI